MCASIVDIQSPTTEIRRGKKKKKKEPQHENIYGLPYCIGGHKKVTKFSSVHQKCDSASFSLAFVALL